MPDRFYITTPIYYVNDVPHLGTAYSTVVADALRQAHALFGHETRMLTGTDEHGLKIAQTAEARGVPPQAFVDEVSERFRTAWPRLGVNPDDFIRTTEPRHVAFVQELWKKVEANGFLYEDAYEDWYCVGCEGFKTEKELLPGNLCAIHLKPVEKVKESTYFFKLSQFQDQLLELYRTRPEFVEPETRRNEVRTFVEGGLRDLSVSRTSFSWGIPVPGNPKHVMYVWFDALANYLSALGGTDGPHGRFWPPNGKVVHLVGKDIVRFHAVYWPAFLLAAGYPKESLPTTVYAHGFLNIDGQKMSKSLRNAVDPLVIAREMGSDVLRYYLLRAISLGQDGDFDRKGLVERYNADLGKNLGNLLNRVLGLVTKLAGGVVPAMGERTSLEDELVLAVEKASTDARDAWKALAPNRALEHTWSVASLANQYVDRAAPWTEAKKGDAARVGTILATLLETLRMLSAQIWPAMPGKSAAMRAQLGLPPLTPEIGSDHFPVRFEPRPPGTKLELGTPLFPTYDDDATRTLLEKIMPELPPAPSPAASPETAPTAATKPAEGDAAPAAPIAYDHFAAVDLRVGLVTAAEKVPKKDKLLKLAVDLGEATPRTIIAGLALTFQPEALVGKRVVVVANLAPRDFGKGLVSHGMLLASGPSEALHLAGIDDGVAPGSRLK
ncbi:MAG: methionine--tRNA ligase [Polyangiaceae bacterium]